MNRKNDSYLLSCEIRGAAAIVSGISGTLEEGCDRPTDEYMRAAFSGVTSYLERIANELAEM